jgi:hypothetical protein
MFMEVMAMVRITTHMHRTTATAPGFFGDAGFITRLWVVVGFFTTALPVRCCAAERQRPGRTGHGRRAFELFSTLFYVAASGGKSPRTSSFFSTFAPWVHPCQPRHPVSA